ncbi:hypothetical protein [Variovorax sp. CY25R-8]|uniref:hypothetical protein n=1 Tax=Variovorax sp. CY25R-8 TaxID=2855501 RepID=UPI0021BB3353|nr:hypothetical protein [Variovorax sp. CY25R-8]MCT8180476.1 hypothetical protein [Variovorax sp. CY25R-8]
MSIKDRPAGVNLNQFLLETALGFQELEEKYSLRFEDEKDEISEVKVSLICNDEDDFFILVARPTLLETKTAVYSAIEVDSVDKCTGSIEVFLRLLNFDMKDVSYRIDED